LTEPALGLSIEAAIFPIVSNEREKDNDMSARSTKRSGTTLLIVLLVTAAPAARVRATNLLGMEHAHLRGVRITMKDGRKLVGYVGWNSEGFKSNKTPKFPLSILDPTAWMGETKTLSLYTKLYPVSKTVLRRAFPDGDPTMRMVIAPRSGTLTLAIKQIARMRALRMKYDGIEATIDGMITDIRSRWMIRLLIRGEPFASSKNDDYGYVLVSFNRKIGRRKLAAINAALSRISTGPPHDFHEGWEVTTRRLERQRVVVIQFITED
jgi:hypothetical protein